MTPDDRHRLEVLFHEALDHPPEGRAPFLAEACAGNDELRAAVHRLLDADAAPPPDLDRPLLRLDADVSSPDTADAAWLACRQAF